ncbi:MAG: glycosyltransferase family 4 protein [Patescibacteria group bacterium]
MKIALFYNLPFSGAKRVVYEHVKGLIALGNQVDVYTTDKENDILRPGSVSNHEYVYSYKNYTFNLPFIKRISKDLNTFVQLPILHKKIAIDIDRKSYDIVLVHTDIMTQAPFLLKYLKTKNAYFCLEPLRMVHEYSLRIPENIPFINKLYEIINRLIRKKIDRDNARAADNTISISLFGREYVVGAFDLYPKVSYLGVDTEIFKPNKNAKKSYVLLVAEKEYIYGYDLAVEAMSHIPKKNRSELKILSWTKDNSSRISDAEVAKLYANAFVTLCLSRYDTFGLPVLESMACGTPVIALNVAGYRETVLDGENGFLVDFDPKEIAERIIELHNNSKKVKKMGIEGRSWVENNWTWKQQVDNLEKILQEFIATKQ